MPQYRGGFSLVLTICQLDIPCLDAPGTKDKISPKLMNLRPSKSPSKFGWGKSWPGYFILDRQYCGSSLDTFVPISFLYFMHSIGPHWSISNNGVDSVRVVFKYPREHVTCSSFYRWKIAVKASFGPWIVTGGNSLSCAQHVHWLDLAIFKSGSMRVHNLLRLFGRVYTLQQLHSYSSV